MYNESKEDYCLISDCFNSNENWKIIYNTSFFQYSSSLSNLTNSTYDIDSNEDLNNPSFIFNNTFNFSNNDKNDTYYKDDNDDNYYIEKETYFNGTKNDLLTNLPEIMNLIKIGENYKMEGENFILFIKPINSSYLENSTHVNFKKCEDTLRAYYNISENRIITF